MPLSTTEKTDLQSLTATLGQHVAALVSDAPPAQTIDLFTASESAITAGQSVTLNWATSNATAVRLNGAAVPASGSSTVTPATDTTYVLDADGSAPTLSRQVVVAVSQPAPPPPPSAVPLWRQNKTVGQVYALAGTEKVSGYKLKDAIDANGAIVAPIDYTTLVDPWNGFDLDQDGRWWMGSSGGHSNTRGMDWQNPVLMVDFNVDAPKWAEIDPGSNYVDVIPAEHVTTYGDRYADGRHIACHVYFSCKHIRAGSMPDGKERLGMFTCAYGYATSFSPPGFSVGQNLATFDVAARKWEPPGAATSAMVPLGWQGTYTESVACCRDPRTDDVFMVGGQEHIVKWTASKAGTGTEWSQLSSLTGDARYRPSIVDVKRNRLVYFLETQYDGTKPTQVRMEFIDLATNARTILPVDPAGDFVARYGQAAKLFTDKGGAHDLDGDVYWIAMYTTTSPFTTLTWKVNPDTGATQRGPDLGPTKGTNIDARFGYDQKHGALFFLGTYLQPIQFIPTR